MFIWVINLFEVFLYLLIVIIVINILLFNLFFSMNNIEGEVNVIKIILVIII